MVLPQNLPITAVEQTVDFVKTAISWWTRLSLGPDDSVSMPRRCSTNVHTGAAVVVFEGGRSGSSRGQLRGCGRFARVRDVAISDFVLRPSAPVAQGVRPARARTGRCRGADHDEPDGTLAGC